MNQDFNTPPQQPAPAPQAPKPNNNTRIYIGIIVLLLASNIYLFVSRNNIASQRDVAEIQFNAADSSRRAVESDYNAALVRLDELTSKNAQMDSLISDQNGEIAKLKRQIAGIIGDRNATKEQLGKAKRLIASLNTKVKTYEERIAELEHENTDLTNKNEELTTERDQTVQENIGLQQKVRLGAVLHVSNIRMTPIDLRRGGKKQKETERAGRVDLMRIMFDIDENRIADAGKKDIYLQIVGPDGTVLSNAAYGSGVTALADGKSLNYTLMKQITLEQNKPVKDVTIDWNQDSEYKTGTYKIDIYHDGYKVGSGNVTLR